MIAGGLQRQPFFKERGSFCAASGTRDLLPLRMGDSCQRLDGGVGRGCQDFMTPSNGDLLASMVCVTFSPPI